MIGNIGKWDFPFDFEQNGFPFGSKSKDKLSPRAYPIHCEKRWKYSFLSVKQSCILGHYFPVFFTNIFNNVVSIQFWPSFFYHTIFIYLLFYHTKKTDISTTEFIFMIQKAMLLFELLSFWFWEMQHRIIAIMWTSEIPSLRLVVLKLKKHF